MSYQDNPNRPRRLGAAHDRRGAGSAALGVLALLFVAGFLFYSGGHGSNRTAAIDHGIIASNSPTQTPAPVPNTNRNIDPAH